MYNNTFGNIFRLTSFGESHGKAIGGVIDGFPAGITKSVVTLVGACLFLIGAFLVFPAFFGYRI